MVAERLRTGARWRRATVAAGVALTVWCLPQSSDAAVAGPSTAPPTAWTLQTLPSSVHTLQYLTCFSTTSCVAFGETASSAPAEALYDGTGWHAATAPTGQAGVEGLHIDCTAPDACVAVGSTTTSDGQDDPVAEHLTTSGWVAQELPMAEGGYTLRAVSCPSTGVCTAIGQYADSAYGDEPFEPVAVHLAGGRWALQQLPDQGGDFNLTSISCATGTTCAAGGGQSTGSPIAATYTSGTWTYQTLGGDGTLVALSCLRGGVCEGVATTGVRNYDNSAYRYDAGSWAEQTPPPRPTAQSSLDLVDISCATADDCTAVGTLAKAMSQGTVTRALAEAWDGTSWQRETTLSAPGRVTSVSCPATEFCAASGVDGKGYFVYLAR